jgi:hypothetical protein
MSLEGPGRGLAVERPQTDGAVLATGNDLDLLARSSFGCKCRIRSASGYLGDLRRPAGIAD